MSRALTFASALLVLALTPAVAGAQNRDVTGKVTRALGDLPVAGATIVEVNGRGVAQSGPDGVFHISVGPGDAQLLVRAIGYQRKVVPAPAGQANLAVALDEDPFKLEAVVVTGQSTTLERRNATTPNVQVSGEDANRAPAAALEQALQGKVPGAVISMNSGAPGGGGQVQIRGITSILGAGQPLFVVDGVIISNDAISDGANSVTGAGARTTAAGIGSSQDALVNRLADINPQEIESIEVIKSAAATAMYGSRATNGVVVIKTKRGTALGGAPQFNLTAVLGGVPPTGCSAPGRSRRWPRFARCRTAMRRARPTARCWRHCIPAARFRLRTITKKSFTTTVRRPMSSRGASMAARRRRSTT
jgi:TonB-dependent SusC/RagA subfamily outer membrane receptor